MPFPYELYPKAKETHCLNLPEISVSRPPFPGSIRTADGCFWGERDNNSYADTTITASDGTSYKYGTVFTEKTTKGEGIACSSYANCYIGCSCNTSNGWYSTCQGSDCKSATDNHYTGVNSLSAGKSISDVASISASGVNSGISASAAAKSGLKTASAAGNYTATAASAGLKTASAVAAATGATSGISTLASGATTCYKKKTCSEGGYYDSVPADQKCSSKSYNGYSCYTGCSYKTCSDYGYNSSIPSGKTCTAVYPRSGLTCYKDCKDEEYFCYINLSINSGDNNLINPILRVSGTIQAPFEAMSEEVIVNFEVSCINCHECSPGGLYTMSGGVNFLQDVTLCYSGYNSMCNCTIKSATPYPAKALFDRGNKKCTVIVNY